MNEQEMIAAFNEWMRRYEENPDEFESGYATIKEYLAQIGASEEPTYGQRCTAQMLRYNAELNGTEPC